MADVAPEEVAGAGPRVERKRWGSFKHLSGAKYDMHEDPEGEWGDAWYYDDQLIYVHKKFVAIPSASVTEDDKGELVFDRTQMTMTAITYDEMRKGCWDRDERVKDLALNYTDGSLPFPTFPRFCGQTFYEGEDKELGLACVKANNDWMVEEWCAPTNGVNLPLCLIPLWDVELAAAETKRNAERGVRAIAFSEIPTRLGLPSINTDYWDPLLQVCNDYGVTICMHVGSSSTNPIASPDSHPAVGGTLGFNNAMASLADWLFSGNLLRFPKLKLAYSEGQIGWIPYVLERADTVWEQHNSWMHTKDRIPVPLDAVLRPHLRLLHRRPPRPAVARGGGRGQHLLRDRLPAHRHDMALLGGLHREAVRRPRRADGLQGPARQRHQDAGARPGLALGAASPAATSPRNEPDLVHIGEGRDVMTRPLGPTKVSSSLALPVMVHPLECTR